MVCGRIISATKRKPSVIEGKSFKYVRNPVNKLYVKFKKKK